MYFFSVCINWVRTDSARHSKLVTRMAHGVLHEFNPLKKLIEDFRERFDFYCVANKISGEGEAARWKQALFLTLLGQSAFFKIEDVGKSNFNK